MEKSSIFSEHVLRRGAMVFREVESIYHTDVSIDQKLVNCINSMFPMSRNANMLCNVYVM